MNDYRTTSLIASVETLEEGTKEYCLLHGGRKSSASRPVGVLSFIMVAGQEQSVPVVFSLRIEIPSLAPRLALRDM